MGDHNEAAVREPHLFDRQLHRCPTCGSPRLVPVRDGADVHFLCEDCSRCWHVELGSVWRVDPGACQRCEHYERCSVTYAKDHEAGGS